jgi:outer membrane protein OmpA-like peptidoglycan-associated protein
MTAPYSATKITNYIAGSADVGNPTLYAAWIRTVSFDANGATGTAPASLVYTSGGPGLKLPSFTEITLRKPGYNLAGWSAFPTGPIITNPNSFVPLQAQTTLYAIWKVQGTSATSDIAFKPGKSVLRAGQKRVLDDVVSSIGRGTDVKVTVASLRGPGTTQALGKARNRAVIKYLTSLGIEAAFVRSNAVATSGTATTPRNNRVALQATWTNPAN